MTNKQLRKRLRLTQADVAKKLGISRKTVNKYENGEAPKWYRLALIGLHGQ